MYVRAKGGSETNNSTSKGETERKPRGILECVPKMLCLKNKRKPYTHVHPAPCG